MHSTILAVDDDSIIQNLVKTALEKAGYGVLLAGSGGEMFDILKSGKEVDLVLLDLGLPDGDAMPHIMELREKTDLPIVIMTARGRQDDRLMALGLGADDYMTKPIDIRELVLRVGNILARNRGEDRPSVAALVGDTPRATPMPGFRKPKKSKVHIGIGAVVAVLVMAGVIGTGVYLGMKSGIYDTPIRKQTAGLAQDTPGEQSANEPAINVEPSVSGGGEAAVTLSEPVTVLPQATPEPTTATATVSQAATTQGAAISTTIVTLPAPGSEVPATPAATAEEVDSNAFASAAPAQPRAVLLGYGWVLESKCPPLPEVEWWSQQTLEEMANYVTRRKDGDWDFYIAGLAEQLSTLYDISARGSAAKTRTGELLEGEALKAYIELAVKRIEIARCLAAEAAAAKAAGQ